MLRLIGWIIKFYLVLFLIALVIAVIGAFLEILTQYWALILILLLAGAGIYYLCTHPPRKDKSGKNNRTHPKIQTCKNTVIARPHSAEKETDMPDSLEALIRKGNTPVVETEEDARSFFSTHSLIRSFITRVVGVSYNNNDGSSRQEILSCCLRGEPVGLYWHDFKGSPACAVISEHGQIGYLKADLAADLHEQYGDDEDVVLIANISDITGGENGLSYGCAITLSIYGPSD